MSALTIRPTEAAFHMGDNVCIYYPAVSDERYSAGSCGQGGRITDTDSDSITITNGIGTTFRFEHGDIDRIELEHADGTTQIDDPCLEASMSCEGKVGYWNPGYGFRSWPRCDYHGQLRIQEHQKGDSMARYADSDLTPEWFDPTLAGERWEEEL